MVKRVGRLLPGGPHFRVTRDFTMFLLGMATFIYETLGREVSDPQIVYASMALMGVAAYLRAIAAADKDEKDESK